MIFVAKHCNVHFNSILRMYKQTVAVMMSSYWSCCDRLLIFLKPLQLLDSVRETIYHQIHWVRITSIHRTKDAVVDLLTTVEVLTIASECQSSGTKLMVVRQFPKKFTTQLSGKPLVLIDQISFRLFLHPPVSFSRWYSEWKSSFRASEPVEVLPAIRHCSFQTCAKNGFQFQTF